MYNTFVNSNKCRQQITVLLTVNGAYTCYLWKILKTFQQQGTRHYDQLFLAYYTWHK